jgi:hypothetical protein
MGQTAIQEAREKIMRPRINETRDGRAKASRHRHNIVHLA